MYNFLVMKCSYNFLECIKWHSKEKNSSMTKKTNEQQDGDYCVTFKMNMCR